MTYLYKLTNTTKNKSYIGVSKEPTRRKAAHLRGETNKYIKEDLLDNWDFSILVKGSERYIYDLEKLVIEKYDTLIPKGYNIGLGGEGGNLSNRKGENNTQAILTETLVVEIRKKAASGIKHIDLSQEYGLTRENISTLVRGDSWKHVGGPRSRRKIITEDEKKQIKELRTQNMSFAKIGKLLNISTSAAHKYSK